MLSAPGTLFLVVETSGVDLQQTPSAVTVSKRVRRRVQKTLMLKCKFKKSLQQLFTKYINIWSSRLTIFVSGAW